MDDLSVGGCLSVAALATMHDPPLLARHPGAGWQKMKETLLQKQFVNVPIFLKMGQNVSGVTVAIDTSLQIGDIFRSR